MPAADFEYARGIGEKLRAVRQGRDMSLRELAARANMSASMLSQIETGKAYPSVRTIYTIADALGLPVDYFFPESSGALPAPAADSTPDSDALTASEMREVTLSQPVSAVEPQQLDSGLLLHASARPTIQLNGGVTWSRLTAAAEPGAEFLEINYACGATSGANLSHHEGREFGLVLEGELVLQLGFRQVTLQAGDSIVFDSTTPHRLSNKGTVPMRALWVIWNRA